MPLRSCPRAGARLGRRPAAAGSVVEWGGPFQGTRPEEAAATDLSGTVALQGQCADAPPVRLSAQIDCRSD